MFVLMQSVIRIHYNNIDYVVKKQQNNYLIKIKSIKN